MLKDPLSMTGMLNERKKRRGEGRRRKRRIGKVTPVSQKSGLETRF
jgi:hypothetical protein